MSVATHLGIDLADYDARIRTFIPDYETMLAVAAGVLPPTTRTIVDLGIGTGALAAQCLARAPEARIVGIDEDADILEAARQRFEALHCPGANATFVNQSFQRATLPRCDAVVSSIALHHVRRRAAKAALYRKVQKALGSRGLFVIVDCYPATSRALARQQRDAWKTHLHQFYTA